MNHKAIYSLNPTVICIRGEDAFDKDNNLVAYDKAAVLEWVDAQQYKELRAAAYPSIQDQLDTIFHDGLDAWKAEIQAVKDLHPKP